jgi:murein DD-endopeptidase MepM/ murein hydrolase activator NlpD
VIGAVYLGATVYWIFHDDLLASLMRRQVDMQYAYEDRIGLLRHDIETVTLRARSEEAHFQADLQGLTQQQIQTESRTALLLALSERMKTYRITDPKNPEAMTNVVAKNKGTSELNPLLTGAFAMPLPAGSQAYAPNAALPTTQQPPINRASGKPHPEALDLRLDKDGDSTSENLPSPGSEPQPPRTLHDHVSSLSAIYDRLDAEHMRILANLRGPASQTADDIRSALATAGLAADMLAAPRSRAKAQAEGGVGGPFVPLPASSDNSAFAHEVAIVQAAIEKSESLRQLLPHIPLRQPLPGPLEVSSGFGARLDPFFGRLALHTGVDLRDDYGSSVHATATGVVISAGPAGGYGNMVEIDHGNGLTTRYAHLSAIAVSIDQKVEAGTIVGRLGSTGRSTGPHLHYETRINGEPVDPERFLKAGARLFD